MDSELYKFTGKWYYLYITHKRTLVTPYYDNVLKDTVRPYTQ